MGSIVEIRFAGLDDTHNPRELPPGVGVRCVDLDLRYGRFEPRRDLFKFPAGDSAVDLAVKASVQLAFSCYSSNGEQLLFVADGSGHLKVLKGVTFETVSTWPSLTSMEDVIDRDTGDAATVQTNEPMEWARFGDTIFISNAGAALGGEYDWATMRLDLRDIKGKFLTDTEWPKSRHLVNYLGYAVLGDLSNPTWGPRAILSSDLPLIASEPTWEADLWDAPQTDPDDRVQRLIYNGQYLLVFYKRQLWRYVGAPTRWRANQLLDIGTLSPKSVEFTGGYVYWLGNDGIPRRTNGNEMVAEKVGAFDYQGKLRHVDGRCPIETGLRDYMLGHGGAGGASEATFRWDSKASFDAGCELETPGPPPVYEDGYADHSAYQPSDDSDAGGIHPEKVWVSTEHNEDREVAFWVCTESEYVSGGSCYWQSYRLDHTGTTNFRCRYSHLGRQIEVQLDFYSTGPHNLHLYLLNHTNDSIPPLDETQIVKVDLQYNAETAGNHWVVFDLEDRRVEDDINTYPGGANPVGGAKYRIAVTRDDTSPQLGWLCHNGSLYTRGRSGGNIHGQTYEGGDFCFRYHVYRYLHEWTETMPITARLKVASRVLRSGRVWRDVSFITHEDESDNAEAYVYLTGSATDPPGESEWKLVNSSGQNINTLFDDPPDGLRWRVKLTQVSGWGGDHAALQSIAISLNRAETGLGDDPCAIAWDGRYMLSLKRVDAVDGVVNRQRDIFVWDRDVWSRWDNVGFHHAAVMYDTKNRQRLMTVDAIPYLTDYRHICCFLEDKRNTWRANTPKFQTGVIALGGLQVMSPAELATVYQEIPGTIPGHNLMIRHRLDSGQWINDDIPLDGDLNPRTSRDELKANEGRVVEVVVGEDMGSLAAQAHQVPVTVDYLLFDSNEIGPRRGYHTGRA